MISSFDTELILDWEKTGAPFEVVARGIRKAAEHAAWDAPSAAEVQLHSLRGCKRAVDGEIRKYLRHVTKLQAANKPEAEHPEEDFEATRFRKLKKTLRKLSDDNPALSPAIPNLLRRWEERIDQRASAYESMERTVFAVLLRALPFHGRLDIWRSARAQRRNALAHSASARQDVLWFHIGVGVRKHLELPSIW